MFGQAFGFDQFNTSPLVRIGSIQQFGFHRLSTIRRKSRVSSIEELENQDQINEDDSATLEEVKDQLFDEEI